MSYFWAGPGKLKPRKVKLIIISKILETLLKVFIILKFTRFKVRVTFKVEDCLKFFYDERGVI